MEGKNMMKIPKIVIVWLFITWPLMCAYIMATISGAICTSYHGFAIDNDKNLYLGKDSVIQVIGENGDIVREFSPQTSRGYEFTIVEDNTIQIYTGSYLYTTDLSGKVVDKKEVVSYKDYGHLMNSRYKYAASDGTKYVMKNPCMRTVVYRLEGTQKTAIYKMPILDYIAKLFFYAYFISGFIVIPIGVFKFRAAARTK